MKAIVFLSVSLLSALSVGSSAIAADALKDSDKKFLDTAATDGLAEVKIGRLAESRASSSSVKAFAMDMVRDHSRANNELKVIAKKKGVELPTKLDQEHQDLYEKLSKLKGSDFDKTYMDKMVNGHKEVISLLTDESNSSDKTLKDWSVKTLPTIQDHLQHAKKVDTEIAKK